MAQGPSGYIFGSVDHDPDLGVQNYKSELRLHISFSFAFTTVDYWYFILCCHL